MLQAILFYWGKQINNIPEGVGCDRGREDGCGPDLTEPRWERLAAAGAERRRVGGTGLRRAAVYSLCPGTLPVMTLPWAARCTAFRGRRTRTCAGLTIFCCSVLKTLLHMCIWLYTLIVCTTSACGVYFAVVIKMWTKRLLLPYV